MSDREVPVAGMPGLHVEPGSLDAADVDVPFDPTFVPDVVEVDHDPDVLNEAPLDGLLRGAAPTGNLNPTPAQLLAALREAGCVVKTCAGWDKRGRSWRGPDGSEGLMGLTIHHTATPGADRWDKDPKNYSPNPTLQWCLHPYPGDPLTAANVLIGRDGVVWLMTAGSTYHTGDGGPWPEIGVHSRGFGAQFRCLGVEIDSPGGKAINAAQIEATTRLGVALVKLCGWNPDKRVITHTCWTNGCHGVNPKGPSPCLGRKNDTDEGAWSQWPGSQKVEPFNALYWRKAIKEGVAPSKKWDGVVPTVADALVAYNSLSDKDPVKNAAAWRVACRLYDLGIKKDEPKGNGQQGYPRRDVKAFREKQGWEPGDGKPTEALWRRLFGGKS